MSKKTSPYCNNLISKIRSEWCDLDLTNKVLLLIGIVLLFELILSIFIRTVYSGASTDAFFRLALSSVLGYFLGINTGVPKFDQSTIAPTSISIERQINKPPDVSTDTNEYFEPTTNVRTLFISFVCLACIITLSITTFYNQAQYEEGLIQLRNIISTTIGFLISKANRGS